MEKQMTQKEALLCVFNKIKKYWLLLILSMLFAIAYVVLSL